MNIAVCIKPVPDPGHYHRITIDPATKLLERKGIPTIINPVDKNAVEAALQLKEQLGGKVVLVSMAPPDARETLKEGLAMGADEAYLLSDRAFAGADTLATARVLAAGLKKIGELDLILTGSESADGGTNHIPSQVGELMGFAHLNHVTELSMEASTIKIKTKIENGYVEYQGRLPLALGVAREINTPRYTTLMGVVMAQNKPFTTWGPGDLGLAPANTGLAGSPTQPGDLHMPQHGRRAELLEGAPEDMAGKIVAILRNAGVLA
ncbi:Acryloyl-CoA reductase electron transfer subunit gamma [Pelotomaculum schinkii]|uniref:Electron transfer flavoprotein small subunit n=1 Tax=Pelotomaculum schinkii TaxID=78350 RepID=A0A4Y7R6R7_9FIRM|nr:electron transfer flavoprotein subunit beta/FixA family protein [Pelotomaculum schinkii]TEB04419.1 Acryloyl-CoA reductase electron transfer subunit gamma [Pelotomaculum schinkii]